MKNILFISCCYFLIPLNAFSQVTYLADTAFTTDIGYGGAPASCKANGMVYNSVGMDKTQGTWVADVFTVPSSTTWTFDTVIVYGYQYGSSLSSPFTSCYLQIYNGIPGVGGTVIWGDTVTNVLNSSAFTGIYKVDTFSSDNGLLSTQRPIMDLKLYLSTAPHLSAGTYWMSWSATCATTTSPATTPFKVLPGRIAPPGQMARTYAGQSWGYVIDNGDTVGLDMIIKASANVLGVPNVNTMSSASLGQNFPNPFNSATTLSFYMPQAGYAKLAVYATNGQLVATLNDGYTSAGTHKIAFNANTLPDGIYYYTLSTANGIESKQLELIR